MNTDIFKKSAKAKWLKLSRVQSQQQASSLSKSTALMQFKWLNIL